MRRLLAALVIVVVALAAPVTPAVAQDPTTTTSIVELPPDGIVPKPNSGEAPSEAGDRGGALQLGIMAVVTVAIGGAVLALVRQSRRARSG